MIRDNPFGKLGVMVAAACGIAFCAVPASAQTLLTPEMQQKLTYEALTAPPPRPHPVSTYRYSTRASAAHSSRSYRSGFSSRHTASAHRSAAHAPARTATRTASAPRSAGHRVMTSQR